MTVLSTARLDLVPFTDEHLAGLNALNADPLVVRYITGRPETLDETRAVIERVKLRWQEVGYSWWSLIEGDSGEISGRPPKGKAWPVREWRCRARSG